MQYKVVGKVIFPEVHLIVEEEAHQQGVQVDRDGIAIQATADGEVSPLKPRTIQIFVIELAELIHGSDEMILQRHPLVIRSRGERTDHPLRNAASGKETNG